MTSDRLRIALRSALVEALDQQRACDPSLYTVSVPGTPDWEDARQRAAVWELIAQRLRDTPAEPRAMRRSLVALELYATVSRWDERWIRDTIIRPLLRALRAS